MVPNKTGFKWWQIAMLTIVGLHIVDNAIEARHLSPGAISDAQVIADNTIPYAKLHPDLQARIDAELPYTESNRVPGATDDSANTSGATWLTGSSAQRFAKWTYKPDGAPNTDWEVYMCIDTTINGAVWVLTTLTVEDLGDLAFKSQAQLEQDITIVAARISDFETQVTSIVNPLLPDLSPYALSADVVKLNSSTDQTITGTGNLIKEGVEQWSNLGNVTSIDNVTNVAIDGVQSYLVDFTAFGVTLTVGENYRFVGFTGDMAHLNNVVFTATGGYSVKVATGFVSGTINTGSYSGVSIEEKSIVGGTIKADRFEGKADEAGHADTAENATNANFASTAGSAGTVSSISEHLSDGSGTATNKGITEAGAKAETAKVKLQKEEKSENVIGATEIVHTSAGEHFHTTLTRNGSTQFTYTYDAGAKKYTFDALEDGEVVEMVRMYFNA